MVKKLLIDERLEIDDLETLKVLTDPTRIELLKRIGQTNRTGALCTVKQLADALDTPATKLYYHINLLEKHGLIQVGETQVVSGIIEKHYQIAAYNITVSKNMMGESQGTGSEKLDQVLESIRTVMHAAVTDVENSLRHAHKKREAADPEMLQQTTPSAIQMVNEELLLTRAQAEELLNLINKHLKTYQKISNKNIEHGKKNADLLTYGITTMVAPLYHRKPLSQPDPTPEAPSDD